MRADGQLLGAGVDTRLQARGDDVVHGGRLVLDLEVVELRSRHDLDDGQGVRVVVAQHRDRDLGPLHAALNEHAAALAAGELDRGRQLAALGHARDAEARPVGRRLHEERQAETLHERVHALLGQLDARREVDALGNGDARVAEHRLGDLLLRRGGGGGDAREGVGDVQDVEEALDAAVLAVAPVQRDERHVVAAAHETGHEVARGEVEQVDRLEPGLQQRPLALRRRGERDLALVRPASPDHRDALPRPTALCPSEPLRVSVRCARLVPITLAGRGYSKDATRGR